MTLNVVKSLLYTPKYLKILVTEEMKIIENGEDLNSSKGAYLRYLSLVSH
jgi:hypothetical protein